MIKQQGVLTNPVSGDKSFKRVIALIIILWVLCTATGLLVTGLFVQIPEWMINLVEFIFTGGCSLALGTVLDRVFKK